MGRQQNYPDRSGINRYGEENISPDIYEDEAGMRHPLLGELAHSVEWSSDPRSESAGENHRGRSDERISKEVSEALRSDPTVDSSRIKAKVQNGIVVLVGEARDRLEKRVAEMVVTDVPGVREIRNEIVLSGLSH